MLLVEVESVERNCKVLINMDLVVEVVPLMAGGTTLFFTDSAAVNGKTAYQVKDSFSQFQQFAMQTVTADDVAKKVKTLKGAASQELEIPKL
jgi:hypothetical protein